MANTSESNKEDTIKQGDDYSNIKDFVCPTMSVPKKILRSTSAITDGKSVEDFIAERLQNINELRKKGRKIAKNKGEDDSIPKRNWFKNMMWWCAGADRELLYVCPSDHSKYVGIGTVILFTAIIATISGAFAINMIATNNNGWSWWSTLGIVWGMMIFFLDRYITNTMYSDGKVTISWLEFRCALPRIIISIFIGIVISTPLELKIFGDKINNVIEQHRDNEKKEYTTNHINNFDKKYQPEIDRLNQECQDIDNVIKEKERQPINAVFILTRTSTDTSGRSKQSSTINTEEQKRREELHKDSITNLKAELVQKQDTLRINKELQATNLTDTVEKWFDKVVFDKGLMRQIRVLHEIAMEGFEEAPIALDSIETMTLSKEKGFVHVTTVSKNSSFLETLTNPKIYVIPTIILVLISILILLRKELSTRDKIRKIVMFILSIVVLFLIIQFVINNTSIARFFYFITSPVGLIMLFFIIIDVSPVFYKMMVADGIYDKILHKEKKIVEDRIRLDLVKTLYKIDNSDVSEMSAFIFGDSYQKMKVRKSEYEKLFDSKEEQTKDIVDLYEENEEIRKQVIEQKKNVIKSAYSAWVKAMEKTIKDNHSKDNEENNNT